MSDESEGPGRAAASPASDASMVLAGLEACVDWVWETDAEGRFTRIHVTGPPISGHGVVELIGKRRVELPWLVGEPESWRDYDDLLRQRKPFRDFRFQLRRPDGGRSLISVSAVPIFDAGGAFRGYRGIGVDISADAEARTLLQRLAQDLSSLTGQAFLQHAVLELAAALAADYVLVGRQVGDRGDAIETVAMCSGGAIVANMTYALAGTPCANVFTRGLCLHQSGVQALFPDDPVLAEMGIESYVGVPLFSSSGKALGLLAILKKTPITDVALTPSIMRVFAGRMASELERQMSERALRASEARFRTVVDNLPDALILKDASRRVALINRQHENWFGIPAERMVGHTVEEFADLVGDPDGMRKTLAEDDEVYRTGKMLRRERSQRVLGGVVRQMLLSKFPLLDEDGNVTAVATTITDIDELARAHLALLRANKMEAVGRLASGIAHDFNNLLGAITGFAGFLAQDLAAGTAQQGYADRILAACTRAQALIGHLQGFTQSFGGVRQSVDLRIALADMSELLRAAVTKVPRLDFSLGDVALPVTVDVGEVSQAVLNLCINAVEALGDAGGTVTIALARLEPGDEDYDSLVRPADDLSWLASGFLDRAREYARLTVRDTGAGIDAAVLPHIFEPFFTTKDPIGGAGLGLAVVHRIVTSYGGAYRVGTRLGAGSRFAIYLPLSAPIEPEPGTGDAFAEIRGRERVLVVDNEVDLTDVLSIGLERLGYEVASVNDATEAIDAFAQDMSAWDVVVTDEVMPNMRGTELASRLRAMRADLKIILCTGFVDREIEERARAAGIDAVVLKPTRPELVAQRIRQLRGGKTG